MQLLSSATRGASASMHAREGRKTLRNWSKAWMPGENLRYFFPVGKDPETNRLEIVSGLFWGYRADFDTFKTTFIPTIGELDADGRPIGTPDVMYQFARISRLFVNGLHEKEEKEILSKPFPTDAMQRQALKDLDHKYDAKNNMNAVKPVLSGPMDIICTEVVAVKMKDGVPDVEHAEVFSVPLSSKLYGILTRMLEDPKFTLDEEDDFLEIEIVYPASTDKGASGRDANPSGLTREFRLKNACPDAWKVLKGSAAMQAICWDSDVMAKRRVRPQSDSVVLNAITKYVYMSSEYLNYLGEDDTDTLCKNTGILTSLDQDLKFISDAELKEKLKSIAAETKAPNTPEIPIPTVDSMQLNATVNDLSNAAAGITPPAQNAGDTQPVPDLSNIPGVPTVDSLLKRESNLATQLTDEELGDIDMSLGLE